ncbi:LysR family transcriptional regulator [Mesorhizobium sp. M2A.F.Ca.ET.037.01.1.1]|uniref:LysR family transcriptional regulator n=2 Tax=unclassified Mesorhizobium TaxID=325217 RepID=UPI000FCC0504|nr:LysR family transcriptional regulator [Mesorhizobium sp. M2A.F.Ca.ET.037.01.1.1]RUX22753.1 LysR family transcriptional regulator [Mesorhizobium sp. M2A.F.Ca.ET.037.01.1.1]RUY13082.1 LysR family transcriptional regulator [Mesorhizobium sp. M2A.F.Ca.ET.040.01.1.1]RWA91544.1 MAG: LysR family transcriptional regulator [Mesorhizobium sp.]TIV15117.1 MAG: LysR family transcriptional regulator [Mesorhizobium sp.]
MPTRVMDLDLRLLRVFVAVVEAESYTGAQITLNVGHSTISLHMSDLEKRLGFRLCERGRSGFRLTEKGRTAYEETKRMLAQLDDFAGSMAGLKKRLAGRLVIGMVDCLTMDPRFPLALALREFNELDHDVHVELVVSDRLDLERAILSGHMHGAIVPYVRDIGGIHFRPLLEETHRLFVGRGHPLFSKTAEEILEDEVLKYPFVMRGYRQPFDEEYFPALRYHATINNMEAMLVMLLSGGYVGFLPEHYARYWVERSELKPVECKSLVYRSRHQWATSISKSAPKAPAFAAFSKVFERFLEPDAR